MANLVHVHPDGRSCRYDADDDMWMYTTQPNRFLAQCSLAHPVAEREPDGEQPSDDVMPSHKYPEDPSEGRGDFGMPTLGFGAVRVTPWEPTNNPTHRPSMPEFKMTVTERGIMVDFGENGYQTDAMTDDARYILTKVLPPLLSRFLTKNHKYAKAQDIDLGVKGIVPDVNRKSSVIVNRIWFGDGWVDEDTEEVIDDLIGHLLLMRAKMRDQS